MHLGRHEPELVQCVENNREQLERLPTALVSVTLSEAGAIRYTQYNILVRLMLRSIAKCVGAATDTSRDYVYTDGLDPDHFVEEIAAEIAASCAAGPVIPPTAPALS